MIHQATVALRPETPADLPFLLDLYLSTRDDEFGLRHLAPKERSELLKRQFEWQRQHFLRAFPQAWLTVITVNDIPAGRFYVAKTLKQLRIVDLSLLPEYRGHGIGARLILNTKAESMHTQSPIHLSVHHSNPAIGFYRKQGFQIISSDGIRAEMEWHPRPPP